MPPPSVTSVYRHRHLQTSFRTHRQIMWSTHQIISRRQRHLQILRVSRRTHQVGTTTQILRGWCTSSKRRRRTLNPYRHRKGTHDDATLLPPLARRIPSPPLAICSRLCVLVAQPHTKPNTWLGTTRALLRNAHRLPTPATIPCMGLPRIRAESNPTRRKENSQMGTSCPQRPIPRIQQESLINDRDPSQHPNRLHHSPIPCRL